MYVHYLMHDVYVHFISSKRTVMLYCMIMRFPNWWSSVEQKSDTQASLISMEPQSSMGCHKRVCQAQQNSSWWLRSCSVDFWYLTVWKHKSTVRKLNIDNPCDIPIHCHNCYHYSGFQIQLWHITVYILAITRFDNWWSSREQHAGQIVGARCTE